MFATDLHNLNPVNKCMTTGFNHQEVEIARVELESTTADVISLRVRPAGSRIKYRLADEYETEFRLPRRISRIAFSLRELIFPWIFLE
jgi:hypothetical protein